MQVALSNKIREFSCTCLIEKTICRDFQLKLYVQFYTLSHDPKLTSWLKLHQCTRAPPLLLLRFLHIFLTSITFMHLVIRLVRLSVKKEIHVPICDYNLYLFLPSTVYQCQVHKCCDHSVHTQQPQQAAPEHILCMWPWKEDELMESSSRRDEKCRSLLLPPGLQSSK